MGERGRRRTLCRTPHRRATRQADGPFSAACFSLLKNLPHLFHHPLHYLGLLHLADCLALDVEHAGAVASGYADVGIHGLARAVHNAAHYRDLDRVGEVGEPPLYLLGDLHAVELETAARRARYNRRAALPYIEGLQYLPAGPDFVDRVARERDAHGIAQALGEEHAEAHGGFYAAGKDRARLGDAYVEGVIDLLGEQPVALYRERHARCLEGYLYVREVHVLEDGDVSHRALHERGGRGGALLGGVVLLERASVHAYPYRHGPLLRGLYDLPDPADVPYVAGVYPQAVDPALQ